MVAAHAEYFYDCGKAGARQHIAAILVLILALFLNNTCPDLGTLIWKSNAAGGYGVLLNGGTGATPVLAGTMPNGADTPTLNPILDTTGPLDQALLWRGRYADVTGFVYMGARYYEPQSGRFLSPDPLGHASSMSLYDYANGDPVNQVDPDGRAIYGDDGTWFSENGQYDGYRGQTLVNEIVHSYNGNWQYYRGPGNEVENGKAGIYWGGITGSGVTSVANRMYQDIVRNYNQGDKEIIIVGYSRGNVSVMMSQQMLYTQGIPDLSGPHTTFQGKEIYGRYLVEPMSTDKVINQIHMIDPVYAMGIGNYPTTFSPMVDQAYVYLAQQSNVESAGYVLGSTLDNRTYPSSAITLGYSGNHQDMGGAGDLQVRADVFNSINFLSGGKLGDYRSVDSVSMGGYDLGSSYNSTPYPSHYTTPLGKK